MPPKARDVREWLVKARNDLRTARLAFDAKPPVFDTGCFHCQQTAEKALKSLLQWHEVAIPKVHSLGALLDLCPTLPPTFAALRPDLLALSYYAVAARYPAAREPDHRDAEHAFAAAEKLFQLVLQQLPAEVHP
jgi:HEPN domain-containing protein